MYMALPIVPPSPTLQDLVLAALSDFPLWLLLHKEATNHRLQASHSLRDYIGPSMTMEYENLQHLGSEEKNQEIRKAPPPQVGLWHICSEPRLILFSLGLSLLLLVVICVIRSQNSKLHRDLGTLRTTFSNFSVDTGANVQALTSHGQSLQETITSLKAEVEDHRQELLAAHSLNLKVVSVWTAACRNRSRNSKQINLRCFGESSNSQRNQNS
ncbi:C-type lectin domain family 10 member A-like isoform X2 [Marmota marmota marmota]|uniref:C-type lectin domain family 10 member A-like isoform X2 n=1 Tax=Marmota marmota marmota TaxID=9994 RepID=UPI002092A9DF|nr:C-type lectin domain family 10 member A-like isoform X2 [Marmota marmota marmota]